MGIGLSGLVPAGTWGDTYDAGFQVGLQIHFNRESRHLGRLRIDYLQSDTKRPIQTGIWDIWNGTSYVPTPQWSNGRMEAYSVAYEWMPHIENHSRSGPFGILGIGGTLWNETRRPRDASFGGSYTDTDSDFGFTLSAGAGWRFNPHATLEVRYVDSDLTTTSGGHHFGTHRSYLTVGTSLRF
jgi:opacity protein-like surface antigen